MEDDILSSGCNSPQETEDTPDWLELACDSK